MSEHAVVAEQQRPGPCGPSEWTERQIPELDTGNARVNHSREINYHSQHTSQDVYAQNPYKPPYSV